MMNASAVIFYLISALILGAGILAVTSLKIFRAAIFLLFSLVGIAALYFWMQVQFIAAVQIIVYVGGIVVLIIFSVFLTAKSGKDMDRPPVTRKYFALLAVVFGMAFTYRLIDNHGFSPYPSRPIDVSVNEIGSRLLGTGYNGYILPFEVVSVLLLAAMIGCIVIAMKSNSGETIGQADKTIEDDIVAPIKKMEE